MDVLNKEIAHKAAVVLRRADHSKAVNKADKVLAVRDKAVKAAHKMVAADNVRQCL